MFTVEGQNSLFTPKAWDKATLRVDGCHRTEDGGTRLGQEYSPSGIFLPLGSTLRYNIPDR